MDPAILSLPEPPPDPPALSILSLLPRPLNPHAALYSKILASSGGSTIAIADSTLSDFDPEPRPCAHASCNDFAAHEILWDHFGFIPPHPDLVLDGYKPPSPLSSTKLPPPVNLSHSRTSPSIILPSLPKMTKKRRSLQSILVPSFLPQASTSASAIAAPPPRARSHTVTSSSDLSNVECSPDWLSFYNGASSPIVPATPSRNSPPPDLLDDDPFANRSPAPSLRSSRATSPVRTVFDIFADGPQASLPPPRSPLALVDGLPEDGSRVLRHASSYSSFQGLANVPSAPPPTPSEPSTPLLRRPKSSGPPQVRPAYTRPAFAPRPSLPSLNTLARTSIHVPKARKGRPGAHLPLEPWEDSAPSAPSEPPSPTWSLRNSPITRRRGHLRRPTLSMIRDSRMYLDGENAEDGGVEDGGIPPLEPEDKESSSACSTPMPIAQPRDRGDFGMGTSFLSISPEEHRGSFEDDLEQPPTPPPKTPGLAWHARSVSQTSATSTSTVPSLCPSSPTSSLFTESHLRPQSSSGSHEQRASSLRPSSPSPTRLHPHVHVDTDHAGPTSYPAVFAHQRHTQFLTSDLIASLEYDYSDAVTRLDAATTMGLAVPRSPSALFPSGDFEPGSSAGTIRAVPQARIQPGAHEEPPRPLSDSSAGSKDSNEAVDAHSSSPRFLGVPLSPLSPPEPPSSSSEPSAESSPARSPCSSLSRSSSFSTVSSEYDFGEDEYAYQDGYSYDVGSFADPLASPPAHARPVFGYGIPWPSTHRTSAGSGSGGSGSGGSMSDVLSDLEDLAEDLTERFSLSGRMGSVNGDSDVFSDDGSLADAPEGEAGSRRSGRPSGGSSQGGTSHTSHGSSNGYGHGGSARNGSSFRRGSAGAGGDEDEDDDDRRRRPARLPISARAAVTDSETSEDEDEDESDYGEASPQRRPRQRHDTTRPGMLVPANAPSPTTPSSAHPDTATDDDVPLARQIPTALKAQRTIRRQVRDELDQKREERRAQRAQQALLTQQQPQSRVPSSTINAAFAAPAAPLAATGNSPPRATARPRTKTLPSTMGSPFSVGDLTKKLLGLQSTSSATPASPAPVSPMFPQSKRPSLDREPRQPYGSASAGPSLRGRTNTMDANTYQSASRQASRPPAPEASRGLRPMRSFHRPRAGDADAMLSMPPMPLPERTSTSELQRRATNTSRHWPDEPPAFLATAPPAPVPVPSTSVLDRARSVRSAKSSRRPSVERRSEPEGPSPGARMRAATLNSQPQQPAPAPAQPPASTFSQPGKAGGQMMWQQRVFIGNMQRFCQVEIGSGTGAGDVLAMVDAQGALEHGAGSGGWMLWEVSQDFGMERPIRSFELLSDVCGSWNTDKTVNFLVIKKTLLAPLLSTKAMPSASPKCSGYVQFEYKRGKWQKRWMELREHSLWLSKRDTGKDATFLCSLNNFDAYYVTRVHKAPKPYVFSVKSTDSLAFFESTADYVHVFSCGESEGKNWLEKILLARSYVLYQERNVLSSTTASGAAPGATAGGLQRAGTRKPGQRPAQPLMTVGPPKADPMTVPTGFEPAAGSLLARRH